MSCLGKDGVELPELGLPDIEGIVVVEVDDVFDFGHDRHQKLMEELRTRKKFGKARRLQQCSEGAPFNGRNYMQDEQ